MISVQKLESHFYIYILAGMNSLKWHEHILKIQFEFQFIFSLELCQTVSSHSSSFYSHSVQSPH